MSNAFQIFFPVSNLGKDMPFCIACVFFFSLEKESLVAALVTVNVFNH